MSQWPLNLAEQPRVHALGHARAALQPVLADQHRRVGREQVDLHIVEVELAAPLGRAAIVADVMVERALPAVLELAAGDEDHVGVLEAGHVAAEVAAVPRVFHAVDGAEDRGACSACGAGGGEREEGDAGSQLELADDDGVAVAAEDRAVALEPAVEKAGARARLERGELVAAEPLRPIGHERRVGRAGHRILVDAEVGDEHAADDVLLVAAAR